MATPNYQFFHDLPPLTSEMFAELGVGQELSLLLYWYDPYCGGEVDYDDSNISQVSYIHRELIYRNLGQKDAVAFGTAKFTDDDAYQDARILFVRPNQTATLRGLSAQGHVKLESGANDSSLFKSAVSRSQGKPMTSDDEDPFKYLSYVTLHEAWSETKTTLFAWLFGSAFFVGFGLLGEFTVAKTASFWSILPPAAWWVIGFAAVSWFFRGQEVRLRFPKSFRFWLLLTTYVAFMTLVNLILPTWAILPIYVGTTLAYGLLVSLSSLGKENFYKLGSPLAEK